MKMEKEYFVLYKRDRKAEKKEMAKGRMVYDYVKEFITREEASAFAFGNLQDTQILGKTVTSMADYSSESTYVVADCFP